MPTLKSMEELFGKIGETVTTENPQKALEKKGFTFGPELKAHLDKAQPVKPLSRAERRRFARAAKQLGEVHFDVKEARNPVMAALPDGAYDFVVALKLDILNETLAALYDGMEYPKSISDGIGQLFRRQRLAILSDNIPNAPAAIGPLRLTAPLTIAASGVDDHVILTQPFSLEFHRSINTPIGRRDVKVSSLDGVLTFGAAVQADTPDADRLILRPASVIAQPTQREQVHFQIASDSPIQPNSDAALDAFEAEIDIPLRGAVHFALLAKLPTLSPVIHLPLNAEVRAQDVGVRTFDTPDADIIVVGIRTTSDALPQTGSGRPRTLQNPFIDANPAINAYVRGHQELFRRVVKGALTSGALQAKASAVRKDLKIDNADLDLRNNEVRLILDGRLEDACGVIFHTIDVNFRATVKFRFSIFGGEAFVTQETDIDVSNWDIAACIVTSGLELIIAGAIGDVVGVIVDLIRQIRHFSGLIPDSAGKQDNPVEIISAVFDPRVPIPTTETLPRIEALQGLVSDDEVKSFGIASLRPDDINTYIYAQFMRRSDGPGLDSTPISGARVDLMDQDNPIPPGDDVGELESEITTVANNKVITTTFVTFEPPKRNQRLARGTTDSQGRVKFMLRPGQLRTTAGTEVTTVTTEFVGGNPGNIQAHTSRRTLTERLPDVFFLVRTADNKTIDTRLLAEGFVINLRAKRLGSVDAPLTFVSGGGMVVANS